MLVELLNTMKDNGHFEEFKQLAKEEDIFKKATYGEGDLTKRKNHFTMAECTGRMAYIID